jgi:glutamine amidotransferase
MSNVKKIMKHQQIAIIKYNAGNIQSVLFALERLGVHAVVTDDEAVIKAADKVIFPGVGEAGAAMQYLRDKQLDTFIPELRQPVLGICLGMQLLCNYSEEAQTECLGIFDEQVRLFTPEKPHVFKVPQIGWNRIYDLKTSLFSQVPENSYCYFVHSYYVTYGAHTIATCMYEKPFSAALHKDNFFGVQFHPEKSADCGSQILYNFIFNTHLLSTVI